MVRTRAERNHGSVHWNLYTDVGLTRYAGIAAPSYLAFWALTSGDTFEMRPHFLMVDEDRTGDAVWEEDPSELGVLRKNYCT